MHNDLKIGTLPTFLSGGSGSVEGSHEKMRFTIVMLTKKSPNAEKLSLPGQPSHSEFSSVLVDSVGAADWQSFSF